MSDLVRRASAPYRSHPTLLLKFILLFFIPIFAIGITRFSLDLIGLVYDIIATGTIVLMIGAISMSLLSLWTTLSYIQAIADIDEGRPVRTVKEYFKKTWGLILPVFGLSLIVGLIVVGGFILLIIPGIIFGIWFTFIAQARVLDQKKGFSALGFSRSLVKGNWWGIFGRIVVGMLIVFAITTVYQNIVNIFSRFDINTLTFQKLTISAFVLTIITSIVHASLSPFATSIPTILYLDLKKTLGATEDTGHKE